MINKHQIIKLYSQYQVISFRNEQASFLKSILLAFIFLYLLYFNLWFFQSNNMNTRTTTLTPDQVSAPTQGTQFPSPSFKSLKLFSETSFIKHDGTPLGLKPIHDLITPSADGTSPLDTTKWQSLLWVRWLPRSNRSTINQFFSALSWTYTQEMDSVEWAKTDHNTVGPHWDADLFHITSVFSDIQNDS